MSHSFISYLYPLPSAEWLLVLLSLTLAMSHFFIGVGKTLDPDFSFVKVAAPYARVRMFIISVQEFHDFILSSVVNDLSP